MEFFNATYFGNARRNRNMMNRKIVTFKFYMLLFTSCKKYYSFLEKKYHEEEKITWNFFNATSVGNARRNRNMMNSKIVTFWNFACYYSHRAKNIIVFRKKNSTRKRKLGLFTKLCLKNP